MNHLEPTAKEPADSDDVTQELLDHLERLGLQVIRRPDPRLMEKQQEILDNRDRIRREQENGKSETS